jgi:hypothetical protein
VDKLRVKVAFLAGLALVAVATAQGGAAVAQTGTPTSQPESLAGPRVIVRADPRVVRSFVATSRAQLRAPQEPLATMTVTYIGFTPQAQAAFQHAVNIWSSQLSSPVPIHIEAEFTTLGQGVLGSAGPWLVREAPGLVPNTWYAAALANKITGTDNLPTRTDIEASFNSSFGWYFGTDGQAPPGTYDFVSVVLHELGHGLGFVGAMSYSGGTGTRGINGFPVIYDHFTENGAGQSLLTAFASPSVALGSQLTSNNLFFDGPRTRLANGGNPARIYAPASWEPGSSYSHLNEQTYPAGNPNSLMTPQIASSEAIHDPGPICRGVLEDTGWTVATLSAPRNLRVVR